MRKLLMSLLFVTVTVSAGFAYYSKTYAIKNDREILNNHLIQLINRPTIITNSIDIKQELNIDNKKYVLFIINDNLGDAELTKGINNKYKIESIGYGNGYFRYEIYRTNKGKYLILKGKNYDMKMAYVKVLLDNKEYRVIIPQQEYFLTYCAVPIETQYVYPEINDVKLFNKNDIDITDEMFKVLLQ